jgi:hypothetical protein
MADFAQDIQNFQRYGTYTYKFDPVGNLIFNSSSADFSQVYLSLALKNVVYNAVKLDSFYDPNFVEFSPTTSSVLIVVPTQEELQQQLDITQQENITLKNQLDSVISQNETSGSAANDMAIKQVIIELRKAANQGRVDSDFSETFPYTPIKKATT